MHSMLKSYLLVGVLFLLLQQAGAARAGEPDACSLLSREEASALLGAEVGPGQNRSAMMPAGELCRYAFQKDGGSYGLQIRVATTAAIKEEGIHESVRDVFDRQLRARKNSAHAAGLLQEISGLGEAAFWSGSELYVLQGDTLFLISAQPMLIGSFADRSTMDSAKAAAVLDLAKRAAAVILSRIPQQ